MIIKNQINKSPKPTMEKYHLLVEKKVKKIQ